MPVHKTIVMGGGCFWCTEAIFQQVEGVLAVESGYAGGAAPNPTYETVCSGNTGHAEVINVTYDAEIVSADALLDIFFKTHDPTTLNRQGNDRGTQYRSVIFYQTEAEKAVAAAAIARASAYWQDPIVTTLEPLTAFYVAEAYHQNYFATHPNQPYCMYVIRPKVEKFKYQQKQMPS